MTKNKKVVEFQLEDGK
jgi:3-methyladenine DNA glycosylase/8-oxoguanine DNA glycosylase